MQQSTSKKISYLQFISALMIIALHTVFPAYFTLGEGWLQRAHTWARDFYDAAMPVFFFLSAVLLMHSARKRSWKEIMLRKLKTILLPYGLWVVIYTIVRVVQDWLAGAGVPSFARLIGWIRNEPEYYIFWFLRTLLLLTALYPLLMWCIRKRWPALLLALVCAGLSILPGLGSWIRYESIVYWMPTFLLGCWVGLEGLPERAPFTHRAWPVAATALLLLWSWLRRVHVGWYYSYWLASPLLWWWIGDAFRKWPTPPWWVNASFFLYCSHMLVQKQAIQLYLAVFGAGRKAFVLAHVALPLLAAGMALLLAILLRWLLPWVYQWLTGLRKTRYQAVDEARPLSEEQTKEVSAWSSNN